MRRILKILEALDRFGVHFQPSIAYQKRKYKTWLGGVMSILLYSSSVFYFIFLMVQWRSGQMLPNVTTAHVMQRNQAYSINETFVQFEVRKFQYTFIDPFNPQSLILQPVLYYFQNGAPIYPPMPVKFPSELNSDGFHIINLANFSLAISELKDQSSPETEMMIGLVECQQDFLFEGWECADNSTKDKYFSQFTNMITMRQFIKEFNSATKTLDVIGRESMIPIQRTSVMQVQTYVRIQESNVNTGVLLTAMDTYQYIVDYRSASSILQLNYFFDLLQYNFYVSLYYKLDNIQQQENITYPKISQVLAEGGSIASTIFLLSYAIELLNNKFLQMEAVHSVIQMYYPEFKNIKITKNILGKIKKIEKNGKLLDLKSFLETYKRLRKIGETKLSFSNSLYEISRLQFVLQQTLTSKQITLSHSQGIPLQIIYCDEEHEDIRVHPEKQTEPSPERNNIDHLSPNSNKIHSNGQSEKIIMITSQDESVQQPQNQLKDSDFDLLIIQDDEI